MTEEKEPRKTASVYWRTPEEKKIYEKLKIGAKAFDMSFSDLAKETLSDPWWWFKHPLLLVRFAWEGVWGPYDKLDTMVKILGGMPDRDQIEAEGRKMSCDELLTGLKAHGSGVRVERKISRDMEVDELLEMLQKGAPAFETAYSVTELNQTVEKLISVMKHVAVRQATLEDQAAAVTKSVTKLLDALEKAMQQKESTPQKRPTPRDQVPFYS